MRSALRGTILALTLASAATAQTAEPEPWALSWVRGPGAEVCPGGAEVARAVETRLRRRAFVPAPNAELFVEAYVERSAAGTLRARLVTSQRDGTRVGERELASTAPHCAELADAAVLAIALIIDPEAELAEPAPAPPVEPAPVEPAPVGTQAPATLEKPSAPPPDAPHAVEAKAPPPAPTWTGTLGVSLPVAFGWLPEIAPGVALRGALFPPRSALGLELDARYYFAQEAELRPDLGATFSSFQIGLAGCLAAHRGTVRPSVCLGVSGGALNAAAYGVAPANPVQSPLFAAVARGRLAFATGPHVRPVVGVELALPFPHHTFSVYETAEPTDLYTVSSVAAALEAGVAFDL